MNVQECSSYSKKKLKPPIQDWCPFQWCNPFEINPQYGHLFARILDKPSLNTNFIIIFKYLKNINKYFFSDDETEDQCCQSG